MVEIKINSEIIKLDSLGSEAKFFIQNGEVKVNGEIEKRRGRKLKIGDLIEFNNETYKII